MPVSHVGFYYMLMKWSIFEKNREQLQEVLAVAQQALEEWGMQLGIPKTKFMQLGRATGPNQPL